MKKLLTIFDLLLFPLKSLKHFSSFQDLAIYLHQCGENRNKRFNILFISLLFSSIFSLQLYADGLTGTYYDNNNFTTNRGTQIDSTINFEWGSGRPSLLTGNDDFSIEWTGYIFVPENANYTFELAHDDTLELKIDGNTIYNGNSWTGGSNNFNAATPVSLTQGYHPISIRFVEWSGGAYAKLAWRNNVSIGSRTIIPTTNLFTSIPCTTIFDSPTDAADSPPGTKITTMDGITVETTTCINGSSPNNDSDYYYFTTGSNGILDITASSPNSHTYHLEIGSSTDDNLYYNDTTAQNHTVPQITLSSADRGVYIYVKETGKDTDEYQINFHFTPTVNQAPNADAGPDQTNIPEGTDVTLDGSSSSDDTGIVSYSWSNGSTGATPTISGLTIGTHNFTLTVTDGAGLTDTDSVTITVIASPPTFNGSIPDQTATTGLPFTLNTSTFFSPTNGDTITYSASANLPAGITMNSTTGVLSGTATSPGTFNNIIITATDKDGSVNSNNFELAVGCSRIFDFPSDAANSAPGTIIATMNGITAETTTCISGTSPNKDKDFYYFGVGANGTLDMSSSTTNNGDYYLQVGSSSGGSQHYTIRKSKTHSVPQIALSAGDKIYIYVVDDDNNDVEYQINFHFIPTAPPVAVANDDSFNTAFNTSISGNVITNDKGPGIQVITASTSTPAHGTVAMHSNGVFTYTPTSGYSGTDSFTYTIQDSNGNTSTATVTITIDPPIVANAIDDTFGTQFNVAISGNVLNNDIGDDISLTSHTTASNGSVSINSAGSFTYTPNLGYYGTDTFTYTITDSYGNTDTATVTITVSNETDFKEGLQDFVLINPPSTRNIIGNYAIAGNTIECITDKRGTSAESNSYDGACQDSNAYNDNNYMAKYLDIDGSSGIGAATWNSSSSNFALPDTQNGILWAGLFWQGSINNEDGNYKQRRAYVNGSGYSYKDITSDQNIDLEATDGNKLLLRIDNDASYTPIKATTFYYDTAHGNEGGYYAAYSDVTQFLKSKNLADVNHTATVANITANEGRESGTGNYAGWTMVVIYAESGGGAKARNISVYNGYTVISSSSGTRSVEISGFKLPSSNTVTSQFSSFAGEGEHLYTPDRMFISKFSNLSSPQDMPGATDKNNIFDAILANIARDSANDNDVVNANGIDIDSYDVSDIMTAYRDEDTDIDTVYIGLNSGQDYITPSMMAFATELYRPSVCYDYTVQKNAYDITSDDRTIHTTGTGTLSITLALQSLEGDFDFMNSQIGIRMVPTANTSFDEALFAPNNANTLIPAIYTASSTSTAPMIAIGENVTPIGGTIRRDQRYFTGFNYTLLGNYGGKFEVDLNTTLDFGSGLVPSWQSTQYDDIPRCPQSDYYNPLEGAFNVERTDSDSYDPITQPGSRFPLYTQVVGKDFDVDVVAYNQSSTPPFSTELSLQGYTVDLELINASPFSDDRSVFVCNNPSPYIIQSLDASGTNNMFVRYPSAPSSGSRVDLSGLDLQTDTALKNAAFRVWYLVDINNTILPHQCTGPEDNTCFEALYDERIRADDNLVQPDGTVGLCQEGCGTGTYTNAQTGKSGCYACLRDFFARAVCSRDNFSIRPASYRVGISDNNESTDPSSTEIQLGENDSTSSVARLAAGYQYKLDGIATSYLSDTITALGYVREFTIPSNSDMQSTLLYDTTNNSAICTDKNDTDWNVDFDDGVIQSAGVISNNLVTHSNVGEYQYHIEDANWTLVDQSRYLFKTFAGVDDCVVNSNIMGTSTSRSGCVTNSILDVNGITYTDLHLTYEPYKFDLSGVGYIKHPNNGAMHTYMNDFNNSYYDDLLANPIDMSISFEGNISAFGKDNVLLTNFSDTCRAQNLTLNLFRTTSPEESTLADIYGGTIQMQQFLQHTSRFTAFADEQIGMDKNITLPSAGFSDTVAQGTAAMFLHTTFKKPLNTPVNPFRVRYETLKATGALSTSSAHMGTHIPDGNNTYDQNTTYYFTKVTPLQKLYEDVSVNVKTTPIFVDIYCSYGADCNLSYNLSVPTKGLDEVSEWYYASIFDNANDGTTDLVAGTDAGVNASPVVTPNSNVSFISDTATRNDIVVSLTGAGRPSTVGIDIIPVPWLLYDPVDPNGYPHYQVDFIDAGWVGVGNTGRVGDTKSSTESASRMNW